MCAPSAISDQKRKLDTPKLELQIFWATYVDTGKQTQIRWMLSQCS